MHTLTRHDTPHATRVHRANGAAMAAYAAAGVGAFAIAFFVILNEAGLLVAPALYGPAGGVSGRTTFATLTWLIAWAVLHWRWSGREVNGARVFPFTLMLVALGVIGTVPTVWGMF